MAELMLKVKRRNDPDDGRVVVAVNDLRINRVHANHICHYQHLHMNGHGLRPSNTLQERYLDCLYQYRFDRVAEYELKRIETDHMGNQIGEELFEELNINEFLQRRKAHHRHRIFGVTGAESWHSGIIDCSQQANDQVWNLIRSRSKHVVTNGPCPECGQDHSLWPMGRLDIRHFLCIQVPDFSNEVADELLDNKERPGRGRRKNKTNWRKTVLDRIEKTEHEVINRKVIVGQVKQLSDVTKAPWQGGRPTVYSVLDKPPITDLGIEIGKGKL